MVNGVEVKNFVKGETEVHYIFENVKLIEGVNSIDVKASKAEKQLEDKITCHYTKNNPKVISKDGPIDTRNQHIGL